jgi:hypothetical protein
MLTGHERSQTTECEREKSSIFGRGGINTVFGPNPWSTVGPNRKFNTAEEINTCAVENAFRYS